MLYIIIAACIASISFFLVLLSKREPRRHLRDNYNSLVGSFGCVENDLAPGKMGKVEIHGTLWNAESYEVISKGQRVVVISHDNLTVTVATVE